MCRVIPVKWNISMKGYENKQFKFNSWNTMIDTKSWVPITAVPRCHGSSHLWSCKIFWIEPLWKCNRCALFINTCLIWAAVWKQGKQGNKKVSLNTFITAFRKDNCTSTVLSTCMITLTHTNLSTERRHKDSFYLFFGFSISELFLKTYIIGKIFLQIFRMRLFWPLIVSVWLFVIICTFELVQNTKFICFL